MENKIKYRIGAVQKFLMITIAVIFDLIEFILAILLIGIIANRIITILEYFIYIVWFAFNKIPFTKGKTLKRLGGSFIAEIIPVLGALPMFTVGVWMTIKESRKDDKAAHEAKMQELQNQVQGKIIRLQQQKEEAFRKSA